MGRDGKARPVQAGEVRGRDPGGPRGKSSYGLSARSRRWRERRATVRTVARAHLTDGGQPDAPLHSGPSLSLPSLSVTRSSVARSPESVGGPARPVMRTAPFLSPMAEGVLGFAVPALLACGDGGMFARWFAANKVRGRLAPVRMRTERSARPSLRRGRRGSPSGGNGATFASVLESRALADNERLALRLRRAVAGFHAA